MVRLGDMLVERGALTGEQRDEVIAAQLKRARPFGALAEEMFGVSPQTVEQAWAEQHATIATRLDPRGVEIAPDVLALIERRQAWQFGLIPVRLSGTELEIVTAPDYLARAMRFAGWRVPMDCTFAICDRATLATALGMHYPIDGLDAAFIEKVMGQLGQVA